MSTINPINFWSRTFTGAIFVIAIVVSIMMSPLVFAGLFLMVAILTTHEFYTVINKSELIRVQKLTGMVATAVVYASVTLTGFGLLNKQFLLINLLLPVLIFIIELYRKSDSPISNIGFTLLGIIYAGLPYALLSLLYNQPLSGIGNSPGLLLGFFILIWSNDTFAYLSGMAFGRHHLFPRISPKKTWEGAIGGFIICMSAAWILSMFYPEIGVIHWLAVAGIVIIFGTFGDLTESMLKRSLKIKDSGNILPGHGGMLDRFDAVLFAAPAVFIYVNMI